MIRRRDQRLVPGALGLAAAVSLIAGCGDGDAYDTTDWQRYCVDRTTPQVINVDEHLCDAPSQRYGWYYQQLPAHHYNSDDYDDSPDVVFLPYGQPIYGGTYTAPPAYSQPLARPLRGNTMPRPKATRTGVPYAGFNKPPAGAASPRVIQRGGFGISSGGRAGGSGGS